MSYRNCKASDVLLAEINARWPNRDKASDGWIGDAAHATRNSDHNPWFKLRGLGIVRARDVDKDGIDAAWTVEHLRQLGARRDSRLYPGGYLIFNGRITKPDFSGWRAYTGSNKHTAHFHVSFSTDPAGFDSTRPWGIWPVASPPPPAAGGGGLLRRGSTGAAVEAVQARLNRDYPAYSRLVVDGDFGPATEAVVREFQRRSGLAVDGIVGPQTLARLGL